MRNTMLIIAISILTGPFGISNAAEKSDWVAHNDRMPSGKKICSLISAPQSGETVKNIAIKLFSRSDHLNVTLYKDTWNIPQGTSVITTVDFMDNEPLTLESYGDGKIVDIAIPKEYTYSFLSLMSSSNFLQVGFPGGSEPTWTTDLSGVTKSLKQFLSCTSRLAQAEVNTQPF